MIVECDRQTPGPGHTGQFDGLPQVGFASSVVSQSDLFAAAIGEKYDLTIAVADLACDLEGAVISLKGSLIISTCIGDYTEVAQQIHSLLPIVQFLEDV